MPGVYTIAVGRQEGIADPFFRAQSQRYRRFTPAAGDLLRSRNQRRQMTNLQPEAGDYGQQLQLSRLQRIIFQETPNNLFVRRGGVDVSSRARVMIIRQLFGI